MKIQGLKKMLIQIRILGLLKCGSNTDPDPKPFFGIMILIHEATFYSNPDPDSITATSVADPDPVSGAFWNPGSGSGIGFFRIPDPTITCELKNIFFWVKKPKFYVDRLKYFSVPVKKVVHEVRTHEGCTYEGRTYEVRTHEGRTHEGRTHEGRTHKVCTHEGRTLLVRTHEVRTP